MVTILSWGRRFLDRTVADARGTYENYRENMYFTEVDEQSYGIKPMNCLAHMLIYKSKMRCLSRSSPALFSSSAPCIAMRSPAFCTVCCGCAALPRTMPISSALPEQLDAEIKGVLNFVRKSWGFSVSSTRWNSRPVRKNRSASDEDWELATNALHSALKDSGRDFEINEGDGAFYGPKIDIKLKDALDRKWQCATIQCDFTLPERFDLNYIGSRWRANIARSWFIGLFSVRSNASSVSSLSILPVVFRSGSLRCRRSLSLSLIIRSALCAGGLSGTCVMPGVRVQSDFRNEKLGFKIREAQLRRSPTCSWLAIRRWTTVPSPLAIAPELILNR